MTDMRSAGPELERIADALNAGGDMRKAHRDVQGVVSRYGLEAAIGARYGARAQREVAQAVQSLGGADTPVRRATAVVMINATAARTR